MGGSRIFHSLRFKMALMVVAILLVSMAVILGILFIVRRGQVLDDLIRSIDDLNGAIENSLQLAMLGNRSAELQMMLETFGHEQGMDHIFIINAEGSIRMSSQREEIGLPIERDRPGCIVCHRLGSETRKHAVIYETKEGKRLLRSANPIDNRPSCYSCHSRDQKVNGMLIIDYPLDRVQGILRHRLMADVKEIAPITIGMVLLTIVAMSFLINRMVVGKLTRFVETAKRITSGAFGQRIELGGQDEIGELAGAFNSMTESVERWIAEAKERKEYLERLIDSIEDGVLVVDRSYNVLMANRAILTKQNRKKHEIVRMKCYELSHGSRSPCDEAFNLCPVREAVRTGRLCKVIHNYPDESGRTTYMEIYASPIRNERGEVGEVIEVMRDVTERKYLEAQLIQSEKLATVGRLAAGVAHEINNPMASIVTCIEGLQRRVKRADWIQTGKKELSQYLEIIAEAASRCESITQRLLNLSRSPAPYLELIQLNDLIEDVISLVEYEAEKDQKNMVREFGEDIPIIKGDRSQLSQVFLNLLLNGLEAIGPGEDLRIATRTSEGEVQISFQDNGCGIPKEHMDRIFEPFFTTKPEGEGTGLGLFICDALVRKHRGTIRVASEVGRGSLFTVALPVEQG